MVRGRLTDLPTLSLSVGSTGMRPQPLMVLSIPALLAPQLQGMQKFTRIANNKVRAHCVCAKKSSLGLFRFGWRFASYMESMQIENSFGAKREICRKQRILRLRRIYIEDSINLALCANETSGPEGKFAALAQMRPPIPKGNLLRFAQITFPDGKFF